MKGIISIGLGAFMLVAIAGFSGGCSMFKKKEVSSQPGAPTGGAGSINTGEGTVGH